MQNAECKMQNCGVFFENNSNNGLKAHTIILNFAFYILHFYLHYRQFYVNITVTMHLEGYHGR